MHILTAMKQLHRIIRTLSSPTMLHYVLPVLMLYLVAGTIAQKYIGLYEATNLFFSDLVFWLGPVPVPGLPVFIGLMIINLCFKLVLKSPWTIQNSGIIVTHISVLLLLLGGLLTMLMSEEGYIDLAEGEQKNVIADYHMRDFVILDGEGKELHAVHQKALAQDDVLEFAGYPFKINILGACRNCKITARQADDNTSYFGMAQYMQLSNDKLRLEDEMNMSGVTFALEGTDSDGVHLVIESVLKWPKFVAAGKEYQIALRKQQRRLPFRVELLDFKREIHPGTALAKSYQSRVRIHDDDAQWESLISMNEPLRYKGYTFFQSSFLETANGDVSVLAVVLNAGRTFPYLSGIVLCIGLLVHLWARRTKPKIKKSKIKPKKPATLVVTILLACFMSFFPSKSYAYDQEAFGKLPVLHEGRVKPMESFAKAFLKKLSGSDTNATSWLIETVFNPSIGESKKILKVVNPDVLNILALENRKDKLYSYKEISSALGQKQDIIVSILQAPEEDWTSAQKDLILLQQNAVSLGDLLTSLTLFLPINITLSNSPSKGLNPYAEKTLTYMDVLKFKGILDENIATIIGSKGDDITSYSQVEQELAYLSFAAAKLKETGAKSSMFRVLPRKGESEWLSPWIFVTSSQTPGLLFEKWGKLSAAYHSKDVQRWNALTHEIYSATLNRIGKDISPQRLQAELLYNQILPYKISMGFYGFSLLILALGFVKQHRWFSRVIFGSLCLGAIFHVLGIGLRVFILQRPPVSTLYESILFVGAVCVIYGIVAYLRKREIYWLYIAAGIGVFFHLVGFSHNQEGDSLLMLSAVLNTNFWLATHVICITIGYALCLIASVIAHYALGRVIITTAVEPETTIFKSLHTVALLALLFSSVGTVLGGIWADQSWGRFWGWDPKENGALLIVLWLIWIIHGRISGQMNKIWMTAGLAYLSVIVSLSWFGVNLLGVGLHSYGFTDSAVWSLAVFIGLETLVIWVLAWLASQNRQRVYVH